MYLNIYIFFTIISQSLRYWRSKFLLLPLNNPATKKIIDKETTRYAIALVQNTLFYNVIMYVVFIVLVGPLLDDRLKEKF